MLYESVSEPVGMAARARRTPRGICVNYVYTPPEHPGRGIAPVAVAELTRPLPTAVAFCVLFTDLGNPVSNAIYRRIGYRPVRDVTLHWFQAGEER